MARTPMMKTFATAALGVVWAAIVGSILLSASATAADLSREQVEYLEREFGLCPNNPVLKGLTKQERENLGGIFTIHRALVSGLSLCSAGPALRRS